MYLVIIVYNMSEHDNMFVALLMRVYIRSNPCNDNPGPRNGNARGCVVSANNLLLTPAHGRHSGGPAYAVPSAEWPEVGDPIRI